MTLLAAMPAQADDLRPFPELSPSFDLTAYAATTDMVRKEFPEFPDVAIEISLPKTWTERIAQGTAYSEIARFDGPAFGDIRPYFSVKRMEVAHENTARLEFISYLLKQGYVLRSIKVIDDRNVEGLYVMFDEHGDSYVVHTHARLMGDDMVLAEYAVPVDAWDTQSDQQIFAMRSFKFLKDSKEPIEQKVDRRYFESVKFFYPKSWVFLGEEAAQDNEVVIGLGLQNKTQTDMGRIRLTVLGTKSLKDLEDDRTFAVDASTHLKSMRKTYENKGFVLEKPIETGKPELNLPVTFSVRDVYELRLKSSNYETDKVEPITHELWVVVFQTPSPRSKTYIAELFTTSRKQDLYYWGVNTRAFEIILKSIQ